jgi:hypothetical protein
MRTTFTGQNGGTGGSDTLSAQETQEAEATIYRKSKPCKGLAAKAEAGKWLAVQPQSPANVIPLPAGRAG